MNRSFLWLTSLLLSAGTFLWADHATLFKVRIENVSGPDILKSSSGGTAPAGLSPGVFVLYKGKYPVFVPGHPQHGNGLERLAEDGNPVPLAKSLPGQKGILQVGVFDTPYGMQEAGPIGPGGAYEFTFTAHEGAKLSLIQMFGQSNDLFYAPEDGIELFDRSGNPVQGDLTKNLVLWDAGTEANQEPGFGPDQAPRQKSPDTGTPESKTVAQVQDGYSYPAVDRVLRVTISHQ